MIEDQVVKFGDAYRILNTPLVQVRVGKDSGGFTRWITTHDHEIDLDDEPQVVFANPRDVCDIIVCVHADSQATVSNDLVTAYDSEGRIAEIRFLETRPIKKLPARLLLGSTRNNTQATE